MSDFAQHVKASLIAVDTTIVQIECEKTGTIYWQHLETGECTWSKEASTTLQTTKNKSTSLAHKPTI